MENKNNTQDSAYYMEGVKIGFYSFDIPGVDSIENTGGFQLKLIKSPCKAACVYSCVFLEGKIVRVC